MKAGDDRDVALEAKDAALGVWQARYMDMARQHDYATAEVVRVTAKLKVEEKARRFFQARIEVALALHRPGPDGYCTECADPTKGECDTVKALKGEDDD